MAIYYYLFRSAPLYLSKPQRYQSCNYGFEGRLTGIKDKKAFDYYCLFVFERTLFVGGKTPFGIDCSGFTQMVYKLNGYQLLRDASQQAMQGEPLSFIEEKESLVI
jgi:hypothetical protein